MSIQAAAISRDIPGILCIKFKKMVVVFFCRGEACALKIFPNVLYLNFHVFTGCNANMSKCGEGLPLSNVLNDLKSFVICYIYGDTQSSSLNLVRATKWKRQKKKSLMCLLPDDDSLEKHIKRANFLAYIQRYPDLRRHSSPIGHGWELVNQTRVPHKSCTSNRPFPHKKNTGCHRVITCQCRHLRSPILKCTASYKLSGGLRHCLEALYTYYWPSNYYWLPQKAYVKKAYFTIHPINATGWL